jgi:hypothetical protein
MQMSGYTFFTVSNFILYNIKVKQVTLRHDVDKLPENSLVLARIQNGIGIKGTYYFRVKSTSFNKKVILEIASLGHEIGYHYETMDTCNGNVDKAYDEFCRNLEMFRKIVPVETACMHGSPLSKYDNSLIWEKNDYKKLGILTEPSLDIDYNQVFYITDTGRMWDGSKVSVRDKPKHQVVSQLPSYHSTSDIIKALNEETFPDKVMMTFHPQRWTDNYLAWAKELVLQNVKNAVKRGLILARGKKL